MAAQASTPDWEAQWAYVNANPGDFDGWEKLIGLSEHNVSKASPEHIISNLRMVYESLLQRFPLCYGYWKKYAEWELILYDTVKAEQIYERGLLQISNCVDLWMAYCNFKMQYYSTEEEARALLKRATDACGMDFLSHPIWDKYIDFEEQAGRMFQVLQVLEQVIRLPLHQYARYFEKYQQLAALRPVSELLPEEELKKVEEEIRAQELSEDQVQVELRQKILAMKTEIFMSVQGQVQAIWPFEAEIKRNYFHVKPMDPAQLENWRRYLDYAQSQDNVRATRFLYERCLVACASYDEFWSRYAYFAIQKSEPELVRNIFSRANFFIPMSKPLVRYQHAIYEESQGNLDEAKRIYDMVQQTCYLDTYRRLIQLEKRQKGDTAVLEYIETLLAQEGLTDEARSMIWLEKARLYQYPKHDIAKARVTYKEAAKQFSGSKILLFNYMMFELSQIEPTNMKHAQEAWSLIKQSELTLSDKKIIGRRYLDVLLDMGTAQQIVELEGQILLVQPVINLKKRTREEVEGDHQHKKPAVDTQAGDASSYDWNAYYAYYGQNATQ